MPRPEGTVAAFRLEPLAPAHAEAMFAVLSDPGLYRYLDYGPPATVEELRATYGRLAAGAPVDSGHVWVNEVILVEGTPAGYVQSTVVPAKGEAWIAYVIGAAHQGRGLAVRAATDLIQRLTRRHGITRWLAMTEQDNHASIAVLARLGFGAADAAEHARRDAGPTERLFVHERRGA